MYRQVLAELARARGWAVHLYDATDVEGQAVDVLGERAREAPRPAGNAWAALDKGPSDGARGDDHGRLRLFEALRAADLRAQAAYHP